ncbi:MAG TPA: PD-(D/E)XK nuclease family protein [Acidimicrobiales bacterium]|nr:PD-(D/E)XK nuclease family protein [Acidimicrobiales bacterium]
MVVEAPEHLSPSSIGSFRTCPLAWRLDYLERLERVGSLDASIGTFVHAVAERLCNLPAEERTLDAARAAATAAWSLHVDDDEWRALAVDTAEIPGVKRRAWKAVQRWFALEDPREIDVTGTELWVRGEVEGVALRGIVDRLDATADGGLTVTDYKTGQKPGVAYQDDRLLGVWIYAILLGQEPPVEGRRVTAVRHLYLGQRAGEVVRSVTPEALASATEVVVATARSISGCCETGEFEATPSVLCDWCSFKPSCPAHGGDLDALLATAPRRPPKPETTTLAV